VGQQYYNKDAASEPLASLTARRERPQSPAAQPHGRSSLCHPVYTARRRREVSTQQGVRRTPQLLANLVSRDKRSVCLATRVPLRHWEFSAAVLLLDQAARTSLVNLLSVAFIHHLASSTAYPCRREVGLTLALWVD
jgi:hypothetical protein